MRSTETLKEDRGFILVLGGARSGKSRFAQELAQGLGESVLFVATAAPRDEEMRHRIEAHRKSRPPSWKTVEVLQEVGKVMREEGKGFEVIILDCLSLLISNLLRDEKDIDLDSATAKVLSEVEGIIHSIEDLSANFIVVSNEVGMGLVPPYPLGRLYRDLLGMANQSLAARADEVYLLIAGIPLRIKTFPVAQL